jgi:hypothetical protein
MPGAAVTRQQGLKSLPCLRIRRSASRIREPTAVAQSFELQRASYRSGTSRRLIRSIRAAMATTFAMVTALGTSLDSLLRLAPEAPLDVVPHGGSPL